jgi:integrase
LLCHRRGLETTRIGRDALGNFHRHDLRHTWASWHVQTDASLAVPQELGGWCDLWMILRYAHLTPGHLAPYAGNSRLARPQDTEIDPAQIRTHDVRMRMMKRISF